MSTIKTRTTLEKINILSKKTLDGLNLADFTGQMFGVVDDDEALMFAEAERQKSKNLVDNNDFESGDITNNGKNPSSSATHMRTQNFIKVSPNTTYTLSVFGDTPINGSVKLYTDKDMSTGTHPFPVITTFPYTFTTKSDTNYVKVVLQYSSEEITTLNNKKVQLELGEKSTNFEEYHGAIVREGYFNSRPKIELNKTIKDNDFIIETYLSSDGNTWYRKWASGWKECGGIFTQTEVGLGASVGANKTFDFVLPISFSTTNYSVHLTNIWVGSYAHSVDWDSGGLEDKTINGFKLVAIRQYAQNNAIDAVGCNWYCCGY